MRIKGFGEALNQLDPYISFILANLLWVFLSLPVVTMPMATAGLFAVMSDYTRGRTPETFSVFFGAIRRLWWKSTLIGLIDALVIGLLVFNWSIFALMDMSDPIAFASRSVSVFAAFVLIALNLYLWPLLVTFDMPVRRLIGNAFRLAFGHPLHTLGILLLTLVPIVVTLLFLPRAALFIGLFAVIAFIISWGTWRVIRRYVSPEELATLES